MSFKTVAFFGRDQENPVASVILLGGDAFKTSDDHGNLFTMVINCDTRRVRVVAHVAPETFEAFRSLPGDIKDWTMVYAPEFNKLTLVSPPNRPQHRFLSVFYLLVATAGRLIDRELLGTDPELWNSLPPHIWLGIELASGKLMYELPMHYSAPPSFRV